MLNIQHRSSSDKYVLLKNTLFKCYLFNKHFFSHFFSKLFDNVSFTYTYIIGDAKTREAVIIDPVFECYERDLKLLKELDLNLKYAINTHVHADHVTSSGKLKKNDPSIKSVISFVSKARADIKVKEGYTLKLSTYGYVFHLQLILKVIK